MTFIHEFSESSLGYTYIRPEGEVRKLTSALHQGIVTGKCDLYGSLNLYVILF